MRAQRRFDRYVKGMRRIKEDMNQHRAYGQQPVEESCPCFSSDPKQFGKIFARFADHPKNCRGKCCANPRRVYSGKRSQEKTKQELIADMRDKEISYEQ